MKLRKPKLPEYIFFCLVFSAFFIQSNSISDNRNEDYWEVYPIINNEISRNSAYGSVRIDGVLNDSKGKLGDIYTCLKRFRQFNSNKFNEVKNRVVIEFTIDEAYDVRINIDDSKTGRFYFSGKDGKGGMFYLDCDARYFYNIRKGA